MLYRILEAIVSERGPRIQAGTISSLKGLPQRTLAALLAMGRIREVQGPPIAVVPGLAKYAKELGADGVTVLTDFLEADPEDLDLPAAEELQADNWKWLMPPGVDEGNYAFHMETNRARSDSI